MATLSRRERTEATRQATQASLVDATVALLEAGTPFADLGVEQIARAAGVSRPTFYAYFVDKRALVMHLGAEFQTQLAVVADPWLEGRTDDLPRTLTEVLELFRDHRAAVSAVIEAATYDAEVATFWRALHDRFLAFAERRIRAHDPGLAPERAHARAFALVWMTERTITEQLAAHAVDETALLDELTRFWSQALGPA